MSSDDDLHQIEIGVAYRNLPARAPRPVDIGRDTLERQIQSGVFASKPVLDNHKQEARIGQVLDAWIAPTKSAGDVLMVEYEIDRRLPRGREVGDQVRRGALPHLSLGHNMETGNVEELSVVSEGYRPGTQTMRLPRTLDQRPKSQQDKRMFYASKAEALAMLAQDASLLVPRMETKTATETTTPLAEAKPAETKATPPPPAEPATKPTEDTAMKTAAEAKSETTETAEKRKKPEEESDDKDMSEGVKKLTKLVEEHSDVKALLQELSEKNKTNERIAEVYRKQAAKQFAEGQCMALGLSKGTPEFERRFGEQIQFAAQHPQVLEPLMDQIIARQAELLNPSTPAQGTPKPAATKETAAATPPPPQEKKAPQQEKKPKKESFDFIQSLTRKTQSNLLEQELKGGSSSSSSSSAEPPARSSSSATTESWTRVNTSQSTAAPSMNPFLKQMMEDLQVRRLMNQSQQLVTAKAGHENARHNEVNSAIVERFKHWQPDHRSFDGVCPDRYTVAAPVWQEAKPWPAYALRT